MGKRSFERSERAKVDSRDVCLCKQMNDDELRQQEIKNEFLVIKALMKCAALNEVKCPSDRNAQKAITKHKTHLNSLLRIKAHV